MSDFIEVADRVWVARYEWFDVNVTAVGSDRGLMVVDTHGSGLAATGVIEDLRRLGAGEVTTVVNTHSHFDHTFGNAAFRSAYGDIAIHAHENAAAATVVSGERIKGHYREDSDDPHREEMLATDVVPADHTFSSAVALDLGDRVVELVHPGRGHTDGDLVVRIPDVDVVLAGDLVEESAPPVYGVDCFPLDWPHSMDIVLGLTTSRSTVVPGHGAPVDRDFVEIQRNDLGLMADAIRNLASRGVPLDQALEVGDFPFPAERLADAVRRGYEQLPPSRTQLPLV
ncbi:MAG: MBL fold metallo-hydrolase [Nocardioides sp.]|nr:MBL fold metallo-hydrolase [Nocardioides sp.]